MNIAAILQAAKESEEKRKALYDIMSCMRDVRKRSDRTDQMFEPLKDTVALLHRCVSYSHVELPSSLTFDQTVDHV